MWPVLLGLLVYDTVWMVNVGLHTILLNAVPSASVLMCRASFCFALRADRA